MKNEDVSLVTSAVAGTPVSIILTDPRIDDNPITYVNEAFARLTLYSREFALGRNCRFLQGEATEPEAMAAIRDGLSRREEFQVVITNHRADGEPFRNQLLIAPVFDDDGEVRAYFGIQREVDDVDDHAGTMDLLRELQHRVKNHLSMVVSMIRIQATRNVTPESLRAVGRRVEALGLLYEELFAASDGAKPGETIRTGAYLSRIATTIAGLEGRPSVRVNVDCDAIDLPVDRAARLGLLLSELLTNALEHAFEGRESGSVAVRFERRGGGVRLTVEDDGVGLPAGGDWPHGSTSVEEQRERAREADGALDTTGERGRAGVGGTIVVALTRTLGATLSVSRLERGTRVTIDFESPA